MEKPDISIVIVSWNTRDLLRDCLKSVFAEPTGLRLEVIVVDNQSTDGTAEMVQREFPRTRLIQNESNIGFAAANNRAFPNCSAEKVLLLNPDTVVRGNALRLLSDFLDHHREAAAVAPKLEQTDAVDILGCGRQPTLRTAANHWLLLARLFPRIQALEGIYYYSGKHDDRVRDVEWVSGAAMLVRKSIIERVGPLSETWFMYAEDQEWCARINRAGWKIFHLPNAIVEHHHGASFEKHEGLATLPFQASRELFVRLNRPSRFLLLLYDLIVSTGLALRGMLLFIRSLGGSSAVACNRRKTSKRFFLSAGAALRMLGTASR